MEYEEQTVIIDAVFDTDKVDSPFGKRYGSEKLMLTSEQLEAMQQGKLVVTDILGEYVLFIGLDRTTQDKGKYLQGETESI